MFMSVPEVTKIIEESILQREILHVRYQHVKDSEIVDRKMAPFDIGTTNPKTYEQNKDNIYMFCFDHKDEKLNIPKPMVHPIKIYRIVNMKDSGETFDENELADINLRNTGYDYRTCRFALLPDRDWFSPK